MKNEDQIEAVIIYSRESCAWCKRAKQMMDYWSVFYYEVDIDKVPGARDEMIKKTIAAGGDPGEIPVMEYKGKTIVGFKHQQMLDLFPLLDPNEKD